ALKAQIEPLQKQVAELEKPYQARLTEAKKARLEQKYKDALAIEPNKRTPEQKKLAEHAQTLIKVTWDELVAAFTASDRERRAAWRARIHELEAHMPAPPARAWAIGDADKVPPTHILKRGDTKRKGAEVSPDSPRVLNSPQIENRKSKITNRLELARWLTQPDHPLTARVIIN